MIVKHLAQVYLPDFLRVANQNGAALFKLDVDVSNGLSSLFILREIIQHAKSAYNYTASDDDITFVYTLMVWCLENCPWTRTTTRRTRITRRIRKQNVQHSVQPQRRTKRTNCG